MRGRSTGKTRNDLLLVVVSVEDGKWLGNRQQFVQAYQPCSDAYIDVSDYFYDNWSTADTSIATVDNYGNHTGMGVGSTTSQTSGLLQIYETSVHCPNGGGEPSGPTNDIPVPLGSASWNFFGDAVQNMNTNTWTVQSDSSSSTTAFQPGSTFPSWSSLANGSVTCN